MNKRLIGFAAATGLAVIVAGCGAVARGDTTSPAISEAREAVPMSEAVSEISSDIEGDEAAAAEAGAAAQVEVENSSRTQQWAAVVAALPKPQNQLDDGPYSWNQLLGRDSILPVYEPEFASAAEAPYDDDELVIGVEFNGEAKAYAIGPLNSREMVNDTVGGRPILVTW